MKARKTRKRRAKPRPLLHENEEFHRLSALQSTLLHAGLAARKAKKDHAEIVLHISDLLSLFDLVHSRMETMRARPGRKRNEEGAKNVRTAAIWVLKALTNRPKREEKRLKATAVATFGVRADALRKEVTTRRHVLRSMADELAIPPIPEGTDDDELLEIVRAHDEAHGRGSMVLEIAERVSIMNQESSKGLALRRQKL